MSPWLEIPLTLLGSVALWCVGTVVFDAVHWVLHLMLRSRRRLLRALARPHAVHHEWLDRSLRTRWENQTANVWCHLVPEYLTQAAFTGLTWSVLPTGVVVGCLALQTAVFAGLLSYKGLDINHRAIEILDAYQPSWFAYPAYHALHHVYPDAYFSAYAKLVDWIVGGGTCLRSRRFALHGASTPFGRTLRQALLREGVETIVEVEGAVQAAPGAFDVLVLCDPSAPESSFVEAFVAATRARQVPPEVWSVHTRAGDGLARHYYGDVRVLYRTVVLPPDAAADEARTRKAARVALFFVRRGLNYVPTAFTLGALRDFRRFRHLAPRPPARVPRVRTRAELLDPAGSLALPDAAGARALQ
jgi:hypothetical protein